MSDRAEIAGIEQAAEACWYPATPDGLAFEWGDGCPHWQTEEQANERIVDVRRDADPDVMLRREDAGCWHVSCAECGYRYDEDEWVCHFPDATEAAGVADDIGWRIVDGRMLCSECPDEASEIPVPPEASRCCPGAGSMAHVRGCINHPEAGR